MKTITLDILKDEAINLLKDLEALDIIRIQSENKGNQNKEGLSKKYGGVMTKQSIEEIDKQLKELRDEWD